MQGMGGNLANNNPVVVAAFHAALRHQALIVLVLVAVAMVAWSARMIAAANTAAPSTAAHIDANPGEPVARRVLRVGFGLFWILDGILQVQQSMPIALPTQVVLPASATSPMWVQHLIGHGVAIWQRHPVSAATASVWIQIGVGALLLFAPRGRLSRLAGVVSVGWGLAVWIFGEAFGGIFAPGLSWMFGAPGAALLYCVGGAVVALPGRSWAGPRIGRAILGGLGVFLVAMAVLQAWPGRGFWQGHATARSAAGALPAMVSTMAGTTQPAALASALRAFSSFTLAHGWGVNLVVVLSLAAVGVGLLSGRRRTVSVALVILGVISLADWVLVQDLGFLGGVGTDPNSMLPMLLVATGGYLALVGTRSGSPGLVPEPRPRVMATPPEGAELAVISGSTEPELVGAGAERVADRTGLARRARPGGWGAIFGLTTTASLLGVFLVGAVPMAVASANLHTDPIISEALNGQPGQVDVPAKPFSLVDQNGATIDLAALRGRTVALTFLDPVCTTDCPLIAQDLRQADADLHSPARTAFVAVVANPIYLDRRFVRAFDSQEGLAGVANWHFVTGGLPQLERVWGDYGMQVQIEGAGGMVAHGDTVFVIDASGTLRAVFGSDPGNGGTTAASLTTLLDQQMRSVMKG